MKLFNKNYSFTNFTAEKDFDKDTWLLIPTVGVVVGKYKERVEFQFIAGFLFFKFSIYFDVNITTIKHN